MIPIMLDPLFCPIALIGRDTLAVRRLSWLRACGADPAVFSDQPSADLVELAGAHRIPRLPDPAELTAFKALWIADLPESAGHALADQARALRVLVNVEDVLPVCDFHTPAVVRRGALTVAIGTGGASPAVAGAVRRRIDTALPEAWGPALAAITQARQALKAQGADPGQLLADARRRLVAAGLIDPVTPADHGSSGAAHSGQTSPPPADGGSPRG